MSGFGVVSVPVPSGVVQEQPRLTQEQREKMLELLAAMSESERRRILCGFGYVERTEQGR